MSTGGPLRLEDPYCSMLPAALVLNITPGQPLYTSFLPYLSDVSNA
jgi:hypothetical protein